MKKSDIEDIRKAVEKWGKQGWLAITCEEGAELIQAAAKIIRGRKGRKKIIDEIADVAIVIEALKVAFQGL